MGLNFISSENREAPASEIGGKAANLAFMKNLGLPVPDWVVIPASALHDIIEDVVRNDGASDAKILNTIRKFEIPDNFILSIQNQLQHGDYYSVRSSAIGEDGAENSYAGQFESYLFIKAPELADYIKKVWRSAFSDRVVAYRKQFGLTVDTGIAVIIQKMVNAQSAGVAFGIDPVSGSRNTHVINAVYGLGEGLVSGELNADIYRISKGNINSEIAHKTHKSGLNDKGIPGKQALLPEMEKASVLTDEQIFEVSEVLNLLNTAYGKPQDIEFAFADGKLYLLQSRPVTRMEQLRDPDGDFIVWDNSNIIESYPGVTTPLTFSFIIKVYEAVYKQMSDLMGVEKMAIEANANVFANMLGLINGRVYYNLLSWYKLLAMLPGYSLNAAFMEKMMGVKERFELKYLPQKTKFRERIRIVNMIRVMLGNLVNLPKMRRDFSMDFNEVMDTYQNIDFDKQNTQELMRLYLNFESVLLKKWKAPLVNDFFAMIYFGVLQKLMVSYKLDESASLHNDLLSGSHDIISTQPMRLTQILVSHILENEGAKKLFQSLDPEEIWKSLQNGENPEIKKEIDDYLLRFGERVVGELKLETVSFKQNPEGFIKIIKSFCSQHIKPSPPDYNQDKIRKQAEDKVNKLLRNRPLRRIIFYYFLRMSRSMVSNRENLRYERTRAFGIVRQIFTATGKQFYAENLIENPRDIFYLKKEEIFEFIQGTSVNRNLKNLISLRKKEFEDFEKIPTAERITTNGIVYQGNDFGTRKNNAVLAGDLKGIGCCPGIVRGRVRVMQKPDEAVGLEGDILVTSSTDPGWVIVFPAVSAILVERGSLLSHSAIVSREMGIPCIVGITGLLDTLKTGDMVEMDGSTGTIKITERHGR